jgi:hypothetical protein
MMDRISNIPDSLSIESGGPYLKPVIGIFFDFPIGHQYYFSTGINYASKSMALDHHITTESATEKYALQFLQFPLTLKLLTSEVALDKKLYLQAGTVIEIKIHEEKNADHDVAIVGFNSGALTLHLGGGMEFRLGTHTYLQTGISYNRGLTNIVEASRIADNLIIKQDLVSIDVALIF